MVAQRYFGQIQTNTDVAMVVSFIGGISAARTYAVLNALSIFSVSMTSSTMHTT